MLFTALLKSDTGESKSYVKLLEAWSETPVHVAGSPSFPPPRLLQDRGAHPEQDLHTPCTALECSTGHPLQRRKDSGTGWR